MRGTHGISLELGPVLLVVDHKTVEGLRVAHFAKVLVTRMNVEARKVKSKKSEHSRCVCKVSIYKRAESLRPSVAGVDGERKILTMC